MFFDDAFLAKIIKVIVDEIDEFLDKFLTKTQKDWLFMAVLVLFVLWAGKKLELTN